MTTVDTEGNRVVDKGWQFLDAEIHPPPKGSKILVLTKFGICLVGVWSSDCIAWHPLPSIPKAVKENMW